MADPNLPLSPLGYRSGEDDVLEQKRRREAFIWTLFGNAWVPGGLIALVGIVAFCTRANHAQPIRDLLILALFPLGAWYILARMRNEPDDLWRGTRKALFLITLPVLVVLLNTEDFGWAVYEISNYGENALLTRQSEFALMRVGAVVVLLIAVEACCLIGRRRAAGRESGLNL